jgi:O-antigen/teichoic acid export membrane protein
MNNKVITSFKRLKIYFTNTSWIMAEKVFNIGIGFLVTILVARYLGPHQFGILSYAISLVSLAAISGHMGLNGLIVREIVRHPEFKGETMGAGFTLKSIGYLVGIITLILIAFLMEEQQTDEFWVLLILALSLLFKPFDIIDFWFQSQLQAKYAAISRIIALSISSLIKVGLIVTSASVVLFATANVIQASLASIMLVIFYHYSSRLNIKHWKISLLKIKELFLQGWVVFLGSIFAVIYLKVDQVMLKWIVGSEEVGIYAVAATMSDAWYFVPVAIVSSLFPRLIELRESNKELYKTRLQQLFDLLFLLALLVAIILTVIAQPLINLLYGQEYISSASILVVHIWSALFIFMRAAFSRWILIEQVLMFSLITQGMGAIVNVILNLVFIPEYGGLGAAYATLFSYATASYLALAFYDKTRPVFIMMSLAILSPVRYIIGIIR